MIGTEDDDSADASLGQQMAPGVSFRNRALGLHFSTDSFQKPHGLVRRVDGSETL